MSLNRGNHFLQFLILKKREDVDCIHTSHSHPHQIPYLSNLPTTFGRLAGRAFLALLVSLMNSVYDLQLYQELHQPTFNANFLKAAPLYSPILPPHSSQSFFWIVNPNL